MDDGENDLLSHQGGVSLVGRVYGHAGVAQHGLRPCGGNHDIAVPFGERISDVPEEPAFFLVLHLEIRDGAVAAGAPIHDIIAPVDQSLTVEGDEYLSDRIRQTLVHGEPDPVPVAGGAQALELTDDKPAVLLSPLPDLVDERLPAQIVPRYAFRRQGLFHHVLRSDTGMVGTRHPQRVVSVHPLVADHDVLQGIVQCMPHVEDAGDVRGRDHDGVRLLGVIILVGVEIALIHP